MTSKFVEAESSALTQNKTASVVLGINGVFVGANAKEFFLLKVKPFFPKRKKNEIAKLL